MESFDVDEANEILKSSVDLTDPTSDRANFLGKVFIKNSTIGSIHTNELKGRRVAFNNETARRVNSLSRRLSQLESTVQHVSNKIKFTMATRRARRSTPVLVRNLTLNGPINIQSINGHPISSLVYRANRRNKNLKNIIANEVLLKQELFVNGKVDGVEVLGDNVLMNQPQTLRPMKIESLRTKRVDGLETFNAIPFQEFLTMLHRKVDKKIPNNIHQLTVDNLFIGKFLNRRNFSAISINSLKAFGAQIVSGVKFIDKLTANNLRFMKVLRDQKISNVPLSALINVNETRQQMVISQDIRFTEDLEVNNLIVDERINNIRVRNGDLQVMRKRGRSRQVVTGEKTFDVVHLLSPIVLQGKIESESLEKMNPLVTVNEDLVLQGDYVITGPVVIRRQLVATEDILTTNPEFGLQRLVNDGLHLFATSGTNNVMVFESNVEVRNNLQAVSLNQKPVDNFVKTNFEGLQTVRGEITFKNGLMVHGRSVNADIVNDVDLNQLNKTVLKRASPFTQFIDGNVELVNLQTEHIVSPVVKINGRSLDSVLNVNKNQEIAELIVDDAVIGKITAANMHQKDGSKIFGGDLNFLLDDIVTKATAADGSIIAQKTFNDLNLDRLTFTEENEWKSIITNYENSIAQDFNITDHLVFANEMRVENLIFSGTINDVAYDDMVSNWLQLEGEQVFTAPQTFASMEIENNLVLASETVSGVNLGNMIRESIWIDEPSYIENLEIEGEMLVQGGVYAQTVNGVNLEGKLFLNNTNELQSIKKLEVDGDVHAEYLGFKHLNGIDCEKFFSGLAGGNESANLVVRGGAVFNFQPVIGSLNDVNLQQLHEEVWLVDRDIVLTGENIHFLGGVRSDSGFYSDVSFVVVEVSRE